MDDLEKRIAFLESEKSKLLRQNEILEASPADIDVLARFLGVEVCVCYLGTRSEPPIYMVGSHWLTICFGQVFPWGVQIITPWNETRITPVGQHYPSLQRRIEWLTRNG